MLDCTLCRCVCRSAGEGGIIPDVVDELTPCANHYCLSSTPAVCIGVCCISVWTGGPHDVAGKPWVIDCTDAPGDAVDMVVGVTGGVLLALDSLSSFFSAFFLALQFSVVCLSFQQYVHFGSG